MRRAWVLIAALAGALLAGIPAQAGSAAHAAARPAETDYSRYVWSEDNDASGKCLDASNYGKGSTIIVWPCQFGANERWTVTVVDWVTDSLGTYAVVTFKDDYPGYCVDGWPGRGQQLAHLRCDNTNTQRFVTDWYIDEFGYLVRAMPTRLRSISYPSQCVDIRNWGADYVVQLWDCNGAYNQQWYW